MAKTKVCTGCEKDQPIELFAKRLDGFSYWCKHCREENRKNPIKAKNFRRSRQQVYKDKKRGKFRCNQCRQLIDLKDVSATSSKTCARCFSQGSQLKWLEKYGKSNNKRSYLQIEDDVKNETKVCGTCKKYKKFLEFTKAKHHIDGRASSCRECASERAHKANIREGRVILVRTLAERKYDLETKTKICGTCRTRRNFTLFKKSKCHSYGLYSVCKICMKKIEASRRIEKRGIINFFSFSFSKSKYQTQGKQIATDQIKADIETNGLKELRYLGMPAARFRDIGQYKEVLKFNSKESLGLERNWKTYIKMIMCQKWAEKLGIPFIKDMNIKNENIAKFLHEWYVNKVSDTYDYEAKKENDFNFVHLDYFGPMCPSYIQTLSAMSSGDLLKEGSLFYTTINRGSRFMAKPKYEYSKNLSSFHKARLIIYPHTHKTTENVLDEFAKTNGVVFEKISEINYSGVYNNPMLQEGFKVINKAQKPQPNWSF